MFFMHIKETLMIKIFVSSFPPSVTHLTKYTATFKGYF